MKVKNAKYRLGAVIYQQQLNYRQIKQIEQALGHVLVFWLAFKREGTNNKFDLIHR